MTRYSLFLVPVMMVMISCSSGFTQKDILPTVPKGAEAVTASGQVLFATETTPSTQEKYKKARAEWKEDKSNPDKLIWYGRWTAYTGQYREAISIFSKGISDHPGDARMLRHRGHRYISIREFGRAIDDFEKAALLVALAPDEVEPDGMPNVLNTPVSTLKSNIFYHLGLAYYLDGDLDKALEAWGRDISLAVNDDMMVATLHWVYMALREMGREEEAVKALSGITAEMKIIENTAYHKLCLFYKGEITIDQMTGEEYSSIMNDAMLYGLGNWYLYNSDLEMAREYFGKLLAGGAWASFGYIAAEVRSTEL